MVHPHTATADRTPADAIVNLALAAALAEYTALKNEQLGRMSTRDNLVYATLVSIGTVGYAALTTGQTLFLLGVPVAAALLGWIRASNDSKVDAIRTHLRTTVKPLLVQLTGASSLLEWETAPARSRGRRFAHIAADMGLFVVPGLAATAWAAPALIDVAGLAAGPVVAAAAACSLAIAVEVFRSSR